LEANDNLPPPGKSIAGLSDERRMPRLGHIRLGHMVPNKSGKGEHPEELPYFRFDDEDIERWPAIRKIYGDEPTRLDVAFPLEEVPGRRQDGHAPNVYKMWRDELPL